MAERGPGVPQPADKHVETKPDEFSGFSRTAFVWSLNEGDQEVWVNRIQPVPNGYDGPCSIRVHNIQPGRAPSFTLREPIAIRLVNFTKTTRMRVQRFQKRPTTPPSIQRHIRTEDAQDNLPLPEYDISEDRLNKMARDATKGKHTDAASIILRQTAPGYYELQEVQAENIAEVEISTPLFHIIVIEAGYYHFSFESDTGTLPAVRAFEPIMEIRFIRDVSSVQSPSTLRTDGSRTSRSQKRGRPRDDEAAGAGASPDDHFTPATKRTKYNGGGSDSSSSASSTSNMPAIISDPCNRSRQYGVGFIDSNRGGTICSFELHFNARGFTAQTLVELTEHPFVIDDNNRPITDTQFFPVDAKEDLYYIRFSSILELVNKLQLGEGETPLYTATLLDESWPQPKTITFFIILKNQIGGNNKIGSSLVDSSAIKVDDEASDLEFGQLGSPGPEDYRENNGDENNIPSLDDLLLGEQWSVFPFGKGEILTSQSAQRLENFIMNTIMASDSDNISRMVNILSTTSDPRLRMSIVHLESALDLVSEPSRSRMQQMLDETDYLLRRNEYAIRLGMDPSQIFNRNVGYYPTTVTASTAYLRNRDTQNMVWAVVYDMRDDTNVKLGVLKNSKTSEKHVTRYLRRVSAESMADPRENGQLAYQQYGAVRLESVDKSVQYVDEYVRSRFGVALRRRCAALSEFSARKEMALRLIESLQYLVEDGYVYEGDLLEEAYEDVTGAVLLSPLTHARPIGETVIIPPTMETMGYTRKVTEETMVEKAVAAVATILCGPLMSASVVLDYLRQQLQENELNWENLEQLVEGYEEDDLESPEDTQPVTQQFSSPGASMSMLTQPTVSSMGSYTTYPSQITALGDVSITSSMGTLSLGSSTISSPSTSIMSPSTYIQPSSMNPGIPSSMMGTQSPSSSTSLGGMQSMGSSSPGQSATTSAPGSSIMPSPQSQMSPTMPQPANMSPAPVQPRVIRPPSMAQSPKFARPPK